MHGIAQDLEELEKCRDSLGFQDSQLQQLREGTPAPLWSDPYFVIGGFVVSGLGGAAIALALAHH